MGGDVTDDSNELEDGTTARLQPNIAYGPGSLSAMNGVGVDVASLPISATFSGPLFRWGGGGRYICSLIHLHHTV